MQNALGSEQLGLLTAFSNSPIFVAIIESVEYLFKKIGLLLCISLAGTVGIAQTSHEQRLAAYESRIAALMQTDPAACKDSIHAAVAYCLQQEDPCQAVRFRVLEGRWMYYQDDAGTREFVKSVIAGLPECAERDEQLANLKQLIVWLHLDAGDLVSADSLTRHVLEHAEKSGNAKLLANSRGNYSSILGAMGKTHMAIHLLNRTIDEYDLSADSTFAQAVYANLVALFKRVANYEKAIEFADRGLRYLTDPGSYNHTTLLNNMGASYMELGRYEEAEATYRASISLMEGKGQAFSRSFAMHGLASTLFRKGEYREAERLFKEGAALEETQGFTANLVDTYTSLARLYIHIGQWGPAEEYLRKAKPLLDGPHLVKEQSKHAELEALLLLARSHPDAYRALKASQEYREEEIRAFHQARNQEFLEIYRANELEREKDAITLDLTLQSERIVLQQKTLQGVVLGSLLLLVALLMIGYLLRRQKQLNRDLHGQQDQIVMLNQELNHRVKNNLAFISSILEMQTRRIDNEEARKLLTDSEARLKAVAAAHSQIFNTSRSDTLVDLKAYLMDLIAQLQAIYLTPGKNVRVACHLDEMEVHAEDAMRIGLLINELMTNSYKHAFAGTSEPVITIRTQSQSNGTVFITYSDNGPGLPDQKTGSEGAGSPSLGLKLIHLLRQQLEPRFQFEV